MGSGMRAPSGLRAPFVPLLLVFLACSAPVTMTHNLLMIPGPVEFSDEVLQAAGGLPLSHMDKGFAAQFGETIEMLRQVVLTKTGQPFVIAGSGTLGWDLFAANFVEPGQSVLLLSSGYFGDRFGDSLETYGAVVHHVRAASPGTAPTLQQLAAALDAVSTPFKAVTITHVDTSTGVLMDVKAIAQLVREKSPGTLIVVDGVCSIGGEALYMDEWGVDFVLTASQKALGVPPGLCVVVASQAALKVLEGRASPVPSYYGSLKRWLPIMQAYEQRAPKYFATPPVQLVQALHTSLREILAGSHDMAQRFARHAAVSDLVKDTLEGWGLALVTASREVEAHTLSAVHLPDGVDLADLMPKIISNGVMVAGGLLPELRYFRIGHMHISSMQPELGHITKVLAAVRQALEGVGYDVAGAMKLGDWVTRRASHDEL